MSDDRASQIPPGSIVGVIRSAAVPPAEPPSSLDLWIRAHLLHHYYDEDDADPHILRGLD